MPEQSIPQALIDAQAARRKRRSRQWRITDANTDNTTIDALNAPYHQRITKAIGNNCYVTDW